MNGRVKRWSLKRQQRDLTRVLHRPVEVAANSCRLALVGFTSSTVPKAAPTDLIDLPTLNTPSLCWNMRKMDFICLPIAYPKQIQAKTLKSKKPLTH